MKKYRWKSFCLVRLEATTATKCISKSDLHVIISFKGFSPLSSRFRPPIPHSHPLPSFYPTSILALFVSPTRQPRLSPLFLFFFWHVPLSLCCHPEEVAVTIVVMHGPGRVRNSVVEENIIIIAIIVIISQMRRAKLELCPSPSGWLTVTNSSLIHSTHQLYTGQRSPERQEAAKAPLHVSSPTAAQRRSAALCAQPLIVNVLFQSLWEQRTACHHAFSHCCYVRMSCISSRG